MTFHGNNNSVIDYFIKFGGGDAMHDNCAMPEEYIYVSITPYFLPSVYFPYP